MIKQLSFLLRGGKSNRSSFGLVLFLCAILFCLLLIGKHWIDVPYKTLIQDPVKLLEVPRYTGIFFQIGLFFWSVSITICFFVSKILSSRAGRARMSRFLFVSGMITLIFCLDDVFFLEDKVAALLGFHKVFILPAYGAFIMLYLIAYYSLIFRTYYVLLGIALFFFCLSFAIGLMYLEFFDPILFGGLAKMIGIVSWMVYFYQVGKNALLSPNIPKAIKMDDVSSEKPLYHYN